MGEKVIGYVLLVVGVGVIVFSAFNVYGVFTKRISPIQLFSFPAVTVDLGKAISGNLPKELQNAQKDNPAQPPVELIPADMLNLTSNITAHVILMGFLVGIGHKLSSLGVQLLRPVTVKISNKEIGSASKE